LRRQELRSATGITARPGIAEVKIGGVLGLGYFAAVR